MFISVTGKCTSVDYTRFGIQLTIFSEDSDPCSDFPVKLVTFDTDLSHYLESFTNISFSEIPVFTYPVKVFAKPYVKNGQTKAFVVFNIDNDFDINSQII